MSEPSITIDGHLLNEAQASTIRCAIECLANFVSDAGDELGAIGPSYMQRIAEIRGIIFSKTLNEIKEKGTPGLSNYKILE